MHDRLQHGCHGYSRSAPRPRCTWPSWRHSYRSVPSPGRGSSRPERRSDPSERSLAASDDPSRFPDDDPSDSRDDDPSDSRDDDPSDSRDDDRSDSPDDDDRTRNSSTAACYPCCRWHGNELRSLDRNNMFALKFFLTYLQKRKCRWRIILKLWTNLVKLLNCSSHLWWFLFSTVRHS